MYQLVIRSPQQFIARVLAETGGVDQRLRMFDAKADGKRLGFDVNAPPVDHLEGIARAVSDRQHQMISCNALAACEYHAAHSAIDDLDVIDPAFEADFATQLPDGFAHFFDHADQAKSTDMRVADIEDFLGSAGLDEFVQHFAAQMARILDLAIQLAVGKCPRAAFAELHVGLRVEHALTPQPEGVLCSFANCLAALQDQRSITHLGQQEAGKQAGWPHADHDRARSRIFRRLGDKAVTGVRRSFDMRILCEFRQDCSFIAHFHIQRVGEQDGVRLARIHAALENDVADQLIFCDAQPFENRCSDVACRVSYGQFDFG